MQPYLDEYKIEFFSYFWREGVNFKLAEWTDFGGEKTERNFKNINENRSCVSEKFWEISEKFYADMRHKM